MDFRWIFDGVENSGQIDKGDGTQKLVHTEEELNERKK